MLKARLQRAGLTAPVRNVWLWLLLLLAALPAASVAAQAPPLEFPVDNFRPTASARGYWVTENGTLLGHLKPSFNLYVSYASRPLQLINTDTGDSESNLVGGRLDFDLMMAIGFFDVLELGVVLPATATQNAGNLAVLDRTNGSQLSGGLRDMRIIPKVKLAHAPDDVVALALALPISLPTGDPAQLLGSGSVGFLPTLILSVDTEYFDWALNVGYRLRQNSVVQFSQDQKEIHLGQEVFGSSGVKIAFVPNVVELVGDFWMSTSIQDTDVEEVPAEIMGGLRVRIEPGLLLHAGAGAGLTQGIGAPAYRVLGGVGFEAVTDPDPDEDRILSEVDDCPEVAEDYDQFEDDDGCPEKDNDADRILDLDDKCPLEPEDRDGFQDADGCPDEDNDKDGIADASDGCPNDAEDTDSFEDADGCPDPDNDADGVLDPADDCPNEPEDVDTFEDSNGCPDPDNDADHILDARDQCPLEPEDTDNFQDTDGCPDPDNDGDGILDTHDKCPMEPETVNGNEDDDGCPDMAKGPVQIAHGKITTPPVFFATNEDVILEKSFPILQMVANIFTANPWVKRVMIEGHTDDRGNDAFNLQLSQRRAESVKRFLIEHGVEPERLGSAGYGETRPVAPNKSAKNRAKNRRVDFVIVDPPQSQNPVGIEP